jgi:hypothetical protein
MRILGYNQIYSLLITGTIIWVYECIKNMLKIYIETQMRIIRENHGMWEFCDD